METIKWSTLDNESGHRTLKQHAFIGKLKYRKLTLESFAGNRSLCGHVVATNCDSVNGDDVSCTIDEVEGEPLNEAKACKHCLSKFNALT